MKKIIIAALLSVLIAAPALADNTGRFYVAGDLGTASYSNMSPFPNPGVFRIAGGYHFSPMLAAELGYSVFGDSTVSDPLGSIKLSASSLQIAAVGSLPLNEQFDLIGKIGLASNSEKFTGSGSYAGGASYSESDLLIGLGAQFNVNSRVSVRLLYDSYGKFDNYPDPMKATSISLGVAYNF
jgi:OOP family OmpA-OmpF porin